MGTNPCTYTKTPPGDRTHTAHDLRRDPAAWASRGTYADVVQELKLLWHVLVHHGRPARRS